MVAVGTELINLCFLSQRLFPVSPLSPPELPSPSLTSLSELKEICAKFYRKTVPTELGYSYSEIKAMDDVSVSLLPEKKGTVFKHNEYMIESKVRSLSTTSRWVLTSMVRTAFPHLYVLSSLHRHMATPHELLMNMLL